MRLSEAEKAWLLRERGRIRLDSLNWKNQAVCTDVQLLEMSPWMALRITGDTGNWVRDDASFCYRNKRFLEG